MVRNPFTPGFNRAPGDLAGRDGVLADISEALAVAALDGAAPNPIFLTGGRGVGKTVLLTRAADDAAVARSWLAAKVEPGSNGAFLTSLIAAVLDVGMQYAGAPTPSDWIVDRVAVEAKVFGVGGRMEFARRQPSETDLATTLRRAIDATLAACADTRGLVITVDEFHNADADEIAVFAAVLQQIMGDDLPVIVLVAGLPSMREARKRATYLERATWHEIGLLPDQATREALVEPARAAGRPFEPSAADLLVAHSGGYPFAIQMFGKHAWRASDGQPAITLAHAEAAVPAAERELASTVYASRWEDNAPGARDYLLALARLSTAQPVVTGGDVAAALGRLPQELSYLRDRLLKRGTIFSVGTRELRLPTPGMADWLLDRDE